jgi:hypothetical protein
MASRGGTMSKKGYWAVVAGALGALQAWDSGIFASGSAVVVGLTMVAVVLAVVSIIMRTSDGVRIAALVIGAILLTIVRVMSPVDLNTLHLALFPAAVYILFLTRLSPDARREHA